ncbi:Transcriptional activator of maltose regulon, MalT [Burkholderia diffusa]|nr:Transcriptional activator of maltose regulon, MalT [Burkholderia diffusa]
MQARGITEVEVAILRLLKVGFTASAIASELEVSAKTVYRHFQRINEKLDVTHIAAAVKIAEEHEILA